VTPSLEKMSTRTTLSKDLECGPMMVAIECTKPCTRGPLVPDVPEHGRPIQLNALAASTSRNPHSSSSSSCCLHSSSMAWMPPLLDASFEASAELIHATSLFGITARDKKSGLCGKPPPGLVNSNGAYTGALVKCN
jgi:hypothetical protein